MFFIMRERTKEKINFSIRIIVTIIILGMVVTHLYGIYNGYVFTSQGLLREDKPSGNPMRVDQAKLDSQQEQKAETPFDSFVIKLKEFYRQD